MLSQLTVTLYAVMLPIPTHKVFETLLDGSRWVETEQRLRRINVGAGSVNIAWLHIDQLFFRLSATE